MPEFNATDYFSRARAAATGESNTQPAGVSKLQDLAAASERAVNALTTRTVEAKQRELAQKSSWVGQLELDPNSTTARGVNLAASAFAGTSRLAGDVAGFVAGDLEAILRDASLSNEQIDAIGRHKQGKASIEDQALINQRSIERPGEYSPLERFDLATKARERSANINDSFDVSGVIDPTRRTELNNALGANFQGAWDQTKGGAKALWNGDGTGAGDLVSGVAKLVFNAGEAAVTNPGAAAEYVAENAPQLAIGTLGKAGKVALAVSNMGYASENYQQGIAKYQAENGGAYPPAEERQQMAALAASLALAEHVSDLGQLKAAKGAADALKDTGKFGLVQSLKNTGKAALTGGLEETATEGYQTKIESLVNGTPVSDQEVYTGAVIGGLSGGGMSGGARLIGEALKATPEHANQRAILQSRTEAQAAAIASGDTTALLDKTKAVYSPAHAIAALGANSELATATDETKKVNFEKATEIISTVEKDREQVQAEYDLVSGKANEGNKEMLSVMKERLANTDPADTAAVEKAQGYVEMLQTLVDGTQALNPKEAKRLEGELAKIDKTLERSRGVLTQLDLRRQSVELDVAEEAKTVNASIDETDTAAVETRTQSVSKIITLSMAVPARLDTKTADSLASNAALSDEQRTYFREFSAARVAENKLKTMGDVSQNIYHGGRGYVGLVQYRQRVMHALAGNNKEAADRQLETLNKFVADHQAKAVAAKEAVDMGRGFLLKANGTWFASPTVPAGMKDYRNNGGLQMNKESLATEFSTEAASIAQVAKELTAAYALKFPTKVAPGAKNVTNVSQASPVPQAPVDVTPSPQGAGSNRPAEAAGRVSVPGAGSTGVVGPGVSEQTQATQAAQPTPVAQAATAASTAGAVEGNKGKQQDTNVADATPAVTTQSEVAEQPREVFTPLDQGVKSQPDQSSGLTVLSEQQREVPEGTTKGAAYRILNKAVAFLTQRRTKVEKDEDIKKVRPLVDLQNLLTTWNGDKSLPETFLPGVDLSAEQSHALTTFKTFANKWVDSVKKNFIPGSLPNSKGNKKNADQLFRDPVQDFFNADGTMDENVVTAVIYAAYSEFINAAMSPALMKDNAIQEMHGLEEDDRITAAGRKALNRMYSFEDTFRNNLGAAVVAALGLKAKPDAPQDYLAKVAAAFGVHALKLLERQGLVEVVAISEQKLQDYIPITATPVGKEKNGDPIYAYRSYIKIVRNDETFKMVEDGKTITESVEGSEGVLDNMFGSVRTPREAAREPIKFNQQFAKDTGQTISKEQQDILEEAQKQENRIIPDMWHALTVLGKSTILKAAGWKLLDETKIQENNWGAVEAQNNNLEHQLDGMEGLIDPENLDQPFFANFEVWKNFRVGVTTGNMNLQSSKIHRFMFARPDWVSTIKVDEADTFLIGVAQALGIKIDQQPNDNTLDILETHLNREGNRTNELARLLIKSINDPENAGLTDVEKEAIGDFAANAEGMQTLQALVAYGRYLEAKDAGEETFTATMLVGVDGKTNGPILAHLGLGAAASVEQMHTMMDRGGMYSLASGIKSFAHWYKQKGSLDLYQDLARSILTSLRPNVRGLASINVIAGQLLKADRVTVTGAGRSLVKTPLTSFAFGSSVKKSIENMQAAFVQSVFDRIEDLATGKDANLTKTQLINAINEMLQMGGQPEGEMIPVGDSIENLLAWKIRPDQEKALAEAFKKVLGYQVKSTMENYFKVFIERRNSVNSAIQGSFAVYQAIYKDLREKEIARLIEAGEIAFDLISQRDEDGKIDPSKPKIKEPLHDLTVAQESALREKVASVLPLANTAYTQESNDFASGLMMAKKDRRLGGTLMHQVEVQMGMPFENSKGLMATQAKSQSMEQTEKSPGVAGLPYMMHSLDSYIMHMAMRGTQSLNVHDEKADAAHRVEENAKQINGSTWSAMLHYSPATEAYVMLERAVKNAVTMLNAGDVSKDALRSIRDTFEGLLTEAQTMSGIPTSLLVATVMDTAKRNALAANMIRLETMSEMGVIDQYTWDGGQYEVTDADRKEAVELMATTREEQKRLDPEFAAVARELSKALEGLDAVKPAEAFKPEADPVAPAEKTSPFGKLGTPLEAADSKLVSFFKEKTVRSAKEVLKQLKDQLKEGDEFNHLLIGLLYRAMPEGVTVTMITKDTTEAEVTKADRDSYAWIVGKEIHLLSDDFEHTGMFPQAVLHELVHAALIEVVQNGTGPAQKLVKDLEALRAAVQKHVTDNKIEFDGLTYALSNVDEFIAYGMTNSKFQALLAQVQVKKEDRAFKTNVLIDGLKSFINTLTELLFSRLNLTNDKKAQANSAMKALLQDVTGLLKKVSPEREATGAPVTRSMAVHGPLGSIADLTTMDIFNSLSARLGSGKFDAHLRTVMAGIVNKLQGPFGAYREMAKQDRALTPMDVWMKALATGVAPFASSMQGAPLKASQQEEFAMEMVEATVRAAMERSEVSAKVVYRQLDKLWHEMRDTLKGKMPQDQYDFIFELQEGSTGQSNHLARFAAYGLAHEEFNKLLQVSTKIDLFPKEKTISGKLQAIFEAIMEFFEQRFSKTYAGQQADKKLTTLVSTLVDIEAKKLAVLAAPDGFSKYRDLEKAFTNTVTAKLKAVRAVGKSDFMANNRFAVMRAAGRFAVLADPQKIEAVVKGMSEVRSRNWEGRLGLVAGTANYIIGSTKPLEALLRFRKGLEGERKDIITNRARMVLEAFSDGGKDLTKDGIDPKGTSASVTQVFLRAGLHVLTGKFSLGQIENMLGDKAALSAAIGTLEAQLGVVGRFKDDFIDKANALAYYKVTDEVHIEVMLMNAHSIAHLHGSSHRSKLNDEQSQQAEEILEQLIALYALDHTNAGMLTKAQAVLQKENARTDGGNGVSFILALHKRLDEEAMARNFHGNRTQMIHGHVPDIVDPHTEVKTVTKEEGEKLEELGYKLVGRVALDPADPGTEAMFMYTLNDAGLMPFVTGVVAYTGLTAKGNNSKAHSGYMNTNTADGLLNAAKQADIMHAKNWGLYQGPRRDLSKVKQSYMAPVLNEKGEIVNWRYMMKASTKDTVLKRDNRVNMVMGVLAGSIFDKETVNETNVKVMQALKDAYNADKGIDVGGYVFIGADSSNAQDRETWSMLPDETKQEIRRIWGMDGLYVHNNARDIVFGYRKLSLADAITKTEERREWAALGLAVPKGGWDDQLEAVTAKLFTEILEHFFGKKAAMKVRKSERMWQELVSETKDLIVVKSVTTLMGNVKSNVSLLFLSGVPPWMILKHHMTAWRGATSYERDSKELDRLQTLLDTNQTNGKATEMKQQVIRLKDAIARNPVRTLIENGLMPSIVEDTAADEDIYSYKSLLSRKVAGVTDKVPKLLVDGAKQIYMAQDTTAYRTLRHLTQLSDFMARYSQYQHLTTRKDKPLSHEDAIQQASDDFINYDIPMHRSMQWLDDTGIFMFSKYYLRIQKVISRMFKENTARMLGAILLGSYMDLGPIVLDGSWVHKFGNNPLNWGALQYPGSLDELATIHQTMALLK